MGLKEFNAKVLEVKGKEKVLASTTATAIPGGGWYLLLGPFAAFMMKHYRLTITNKALYFHRLNLSSDIVQSDRFENDEIKSLKFSQGFLQHEIRLEFSNGRKLKINTPRKALSKKVAVLSEKGIEYLLSTFS